MTSTALHDLGVAQLATELRERRVSAVEAAQHFLARAQNAVTALIAARGLRALVHPLTDDDLADHTTLAHWIGEPVELDVTVLDPPGVNQGIARFGGADF